MSSTDKKAMRSHISSTLFGIFTSFAFVLFLIRSDIAIDYMKRGLKLCAGTVIPSLFPFMIISELLVSCGLGARLGKLISKPTRWILGVSEGSACAFILGAICGFPIGAKAICSMLDSGEIDESEATRAMTFCNNPGAAFVISTVGTSLFGSKTLGIALYVCVLLSAITVGIVGRFLLKNKTPITPYIRSVAFVSPSPSMAFVRAIQSSALSTLHVCAYVTFFSAFVGCVGAVLSKFEISSCFLASLFGFFEISSGVSALSKLPPTVAAVLCAAVLAWSGLSVHFQIMTVCAGRNIPFRSYFLAKGAQAILSAAFMGAAIKLFDLTADVFFTTETVSAQGDISVGAVTACAAFFAASLAWTFLTYSGTKLKKKSFLKFFSKRG